jgi:hypothetical protein
MILHMTGNLLYPRKLLLACLVAVVLVAGCQKFVQVPAPETLLSTETVFSNDMTALSALAGMYSRTMTFQGSFLNGGNTLYPALSADECVPTLLTSALQQFSSNALQSSNTNIATLYGTAYNAVYNANMLLENLDRSKAVTGPTRRQIMGEALFMRALIYSRLAELFGPVPLITSTNADINAVAPRSSIDDVYRQVESDLPGADSLLDTAYVPSSSGVVERTRPNKWAVRALSARVHLYRREWSQAAAAATDVIGSGEYLLEPSLDSVFLKGSREAIWQLQPVSTLMNTAEGAYFLPQDNALSRPLYTLTSFLLNAFEPGDQRRTHWTGKKVVTGVSYVYPAKYKVRTGLPYTEYNMVIRLAEMYLIRSEARLQQDDLPGAVADLNSIRARAGLGPLAAGLSKDQVTAALMQERRIELFAEWGHRWLDLKRTGMSGSVLLPEKGMWSDYDTLYPIPLTDLQRNAKLDQNAGY